MIRRLVMVVLVLGVLVGCADRPASDSSADPQAADPHAADVAFARAMIPHHEQALELSALVAGRTVSPTVADLAFRIDRGQVGEIGQMQGALKLWGAGDHGADGHAGMAGMAGMADAPTLERLRASSGPEFDRLWRATMTEHHRGAVVMARDYLATSDGRGALAELARTMIPTQEAEIARLIAPE